MANTNSDTETLIWCRQQLLKEGDYTNKEKADIALHMIMNHRDHQPEY